jgi:outer membrane receptor protein involved in Fe transport
VPFNPFGFGAPSAEARAYVTGTQSLDTTNKLDSAAFEIQGSPFALWAGPVTIAVGAEARWEEQTSTNGELDRMSLPGTGGLPASIFGTPLFFTTTSGRTNVKEAFGEALVPLLDTEQFKAELNGAARYSDYNRSGGIWSWKIGGTVHLFDTLLLRATRSRDIRAPTIGELFAQNSLNIRLVVDRDTSRCIVANGCNPNPQVTLLTSGNPDLVPEISKTWTVGGSFSPSFLRGFNLSVDYYDIDIGGAIQAPDTQDITVACLQGDTASCALVDRAANGTITTVRARQANIASLRTSGVDFEASYALRVASGTLRLRGLASWVDKLLFQTPSCIATNTCRQTAGSVGDTVIGAVPHWRGNVSATYQDDTYGFDLRARYVGGGKYDASPAGANIVNNDIDARIYVDVGAQFKVADRFTFFGNVRNLFDRNPPLTVQLGGAIYDSIGRYFTAGARVNF